MDNQIAGVISAAATQTVITVAPIVTRYIVMTENSSPPPASEAAAAVAAVAPREGVNVRIRGRGEATLEEKVTNQNANSIVALPVQYTQVGCTCKFVSP